VQKKAKKSSKDFANWDNFMYLCLDVKSEKKGKKKQKKRDYIGNQLKSARRK